MSQIVAYLDTCVLYPYSIRDILMQFAVDGIFQAKWSEKVEQELVKNIEQNRPDLKGKLTGTLSKMRKALPDYWAEADLGHLEEVLKSRTDSKDTGHLAAAISSSCTHLVTFNLKDFDLAFARGKGVLIIHPDEFMEGLIKNNEASGLSLDQLKLIG